MPSPTKEETLLTILKESAVKKYGEERAKVLEPPFRPSPGPSSLSRTILLNWRRNLLLHGEKSREQRAKSRG